jgi:hypothetical protein
MTLRDSNPTTRLPGLLPPPELRQAFPKLHAACNELERLRGERLEIRRSLEAEVGRRRAAEHADIRAAGEAHRQGKPDPGSPAVEAVDASIRELRRRDAILEQSIASASADLAKLIVQHRAEWIAATNASVAERRASLRRLAASWGEQRHALGAEESMARWMRDFEQRPSYTTGSRHLYRDGPEGARVQGGRTYDQLLAEILTDAVGPSVEQAEGGAA